MTVWNAERQKRERKQECKNARMQECKRKPDKRNKYHTLEPTKCDHFGPS